MSVLRFVGAMAMALSVGAVSGPHSDNVILVPSIARTLARSWDSTSATQNERAYCASYLKVHWLDGHYTFVVNRLERAKEMGATPYGLRVNCTQATQPNVVLHIHPPTTCKLNDEDKFVDCRLGGPDAYNCEPSIDDRVSLLLRREPFGFIQCGPHKIALYQWNTPVTIL